jgi:predicted short-subunit dehydrogenase-like oxidoreductase (DUF2520 family)
MSRGTVGLIGAGAVGPAILLTLAKAGWTPGAIASPRIAMAKAAAALAGGGAVTTVNADAARDADLLLIAVPDRAIAAVAKEVAPAAKPGATAIHLSGAHSSEVLAPLAAAGLSTGSIHPLQSFADPQTAAARLPLTFLFYEGDDPARMLAVATDMGGHPVPIETSGKALYHAGAAAACNLAVAMVDLGVRLMTAAGIEGDRSLAALLPLIEGTVANLKEVGLPAALTGPVSRGDVETLVGHLAAMREKTPALAVPYAAASLHAVEVALAKGTIGEEEAAALRKALTPRRQDAET